MTRRLSPALCAGALALALGSATPAGRSPTAHLHAAQPLFLLPLLLLPAQLLADDEPALAGAARAHATGFHPMPPPAYMAYPPFVEPMWRYELCAAAVVLPRLPLLARPVLTRTRGRRPE